MLRIKQESFSAISKFSSFVSHELKNSISVMKHALYYLDNSKIKYNKDQKKILDLLNEEVKKIHSKTVLLLDDTRVNYLNNKTLDIGGFLKKELTKHKDCKFSFKIAIESNLKISVDEDRFQQLIFIVIDNAKDSMPDGGDILFEVCSFKNKAIIEIKDFGCGMSKETLKSCFAPLFSTKKFRLGMSLAVAKQIVLMSSGKITAKSSLGKGSKFIIELPKL